MKFKLDENLGPTVHGVFQKRGLDCCTVPQEQLSGSDDPTIMAAAIAEERILVTLDKDFSNVLIFPPEKTPGVVVVQPPSRASRALLASLLDGFLTACETRKLSGKLWIVEPGRIRERHSVSEDE